ncbi:hypothetical protein [Sphingomonas aracearum]|nr:hypothetical protein [Sphingomonas aracearum]
MKMFAMLAAGLLGAAAVAPVPASAAPISAAPLLVEAGVAPQVVERRTTTIVRDRRYNNRRPRYRTRRVCDRTYHHGRRVTRCRNVRVRY